MERWEGLVDVPRRCVELAPIGREEVEVCAMRRCLGGGGLLVMCVGLLRSLCFFEGMVGVRSWCQGGVGEHEASVSFPRVVLCGCDCVLCVLVVWSVEVGLLMLAVGCMSGSTGR